MKVICNLADGLLAPVSDRDLERLRKLGEHIFVDVEVRVHDPNRDKLLRKLWLLVTTVLKETDTDRLRLYDDVELVDALKIRAGLFELGHTLDGKVYQRTLSTRDMDLKQAEHLYETARKTLGDIVGRDPESLLPPPERDRDPGRDEAPAAAGAADDALDYIRKLLLAAVDTAITVEQRERVIANAATEWLVGPLATRQDFVETVRKEACRVARGELKMLDAKKLLEAQA